MDGNTTLGYAAHMKHHKVLFAAVLVAALSGCSGMHIGIGLPIGGFGGIGVSVGSDGRVGGNVTVGNGGVVVGAGGTAQLPPKSPRSPDPIASAPGR